MPWPRATSTVTGADDLAVGVPIERVDGVNAAGAVNVLYGGASGLSATGNQLWSQNSTDVLDAAQANDGFGSALAVGDLNGDGSDDLAVGVVNEKLGTAGGAGAVNVLYGECRWAVGDRKPVLEPGQPRRLRRPRGERRLRLCPGRPRPEWRRPRRFGRGGPLTRISEASATPAR